MNKKKILVTGGAGFIGSHLIDNLIKQGHSIVCIDDLSLGRTENINHHLGNSKFKFIKLDILNKTGLDMVFQQNHFDCVFHMAANSDIVKGAKLVNIDLERTFLTTFNILQAQKENRVPEIVFASSSAIYGELNESLSENSGPLLPISFYGAAKLSAEAYICAFSANFGIKALIIRLPNVVGERATHGVMFDFINRLKKRPKELKILGNGRQAKPYLYVKDTVEGIVFVWKKAKGRIACFNLGVNSSSTVDEIARIVAREMGLKNVKFHHTGGDRGWTGDIPKYKYDLSKVRHLGWKARRSSSGGIRLAVRAYLKGATGIS